MAKLRVFCVHMTKPSNSEAKVLASLLRFSHCDLDVLLAVNARGSSDPHTHFREWMRENSWVSVRSLEVGVPIDPQAPTRLVLRALSHLSRRFRRARLLEAARVWRPDVIYTSQQAFDCQVGELISAELRVPHAVHLHYNVGPWLRPHVLETLRSCDMIFCVSSFVANQALSHGVDANGIVVLRNSLDECKVDELPKLSRRSPKSTITIGQTGRMVEGKGFLDTLMAFARVHKLLPHTRLLLVGDGPQRKELEHFVQENKLNTVVRFAGWQGDVNSLLVEIDVYSFPSRNEPFGMALLEACAAGLPCIAYREGGVPEIVVDGVTGVLVPPGDISALATAMSEVCSDPEKREALSLAARRRVYSEFAPEAAALSFCHHLRGIAEAGRRERPAAVH